MERNEAIARLKKALKTRTGRAWSVTGGRGTAWGWITVQATPRNRDAHGNTTDADRATLARVFGETVYHQGISIPAAHDYRRSYVDRAENGAAATAPEGVPYWD